MSLSRHACLILRRLVFLVAALATVLTVAALGPVAALGAPALRVQDRTRACNPPTTLAAWSLIVASPRSSLNLDVSIMRGAAGRPICMPEAVKQTPIYRQAPARMHTTGAATSWVAAVRGADLVGHVVERFSRAGRLTLGDEDAAAADLAEDGGSLLRHYTTDQGAAGILHDGVIDTSADGNVYLRRSF